MIAFGRVVTLDATPLYDEAHPHAGKVIVTITCTHEQAQSWGELWGRDVQALPAVVPAEQDSAKDEPNAR
jgi:hypothetical protein